MISKLIMKRHVLETCMFIKWYFLGYIYRTLILICNHSISILIQFTIIVLRWMSLSTKYFKYFHCVYDFWSLH